MTRAWAVASGILVLSVLSLTGCGARALGASSAAKAGSVSATPSPSTSACASPSSSAQAAACAIAESPVPMPPVVNQFPGQFQTTAPTLGPGDCPIPSQYHLGSGGVSFLVCLQTSGAVTISRGFRDDSSARLAKTCADLARNGSDVAQTETQPEFLAPSPDSGVVRPDGHNMEVSFRLDPYTGPGTHPISLDLGGHVVIDQTTYSLNTYEHNPASATITVNPDGSGSLTATSLLGATLGTTESSGTLNLSITWSCVPNYE